MKRHSVHQLTISALLIALGILIPQIMPRFTLGPASFTLGSHVPVLIAMFISPFSAVVVALGTTLGFFLTATPIIALRALTHVIFAYFGAVYLKNHPKTILNMKVLTLFNIIVGVVHVVCEVLVVTGFFTVGNLPETYYTQGFFTSVILLMGVGGILHSLIDFSIAYYVAKALSKGIEIPVFALASGKTPKIYAKA